MAKNTHAPVWILSLEPLRPEIVTVWCGHCCLHCSILTRLASMKSPPQLLTFFFLHLHIVYYTLPQPRKSLRYEICVCMCRCIHWWRYFFSSAVFILTFESCWKGGMWGIETTEVEEHSLLNCAHFFARSMVGWFDYRRLIFAQVFNLAEEVFLKESGFQVGSESVEQAILSGLGFTARHNFNFFLSELLGRKPEDVVWANTKIVAMIRKQLGRNDLGKMFDFVSFRRD